MVLTVFIAAPPTAGALLRVILVTGAVAGVVASVQGDNAGGPLQGLGLNPNYLAVYLAAPIVISAGLALRRRNPLWLAPGAACLPALLASQSREGFLAMVAGLAFVIIQGLPRVQKVPIILAAALVLVVSPGHLTSLGAGSRSAADLTNDNLVRAHVALFAVRVALSHPLLGIGLGQFPDYAAASSGFGIYITTTNEYLLLASENGLITLAAFLVMLWLAFRGPCHGDMALVRAVLVTCAVSLLFIDSFESSLVALPFWACLGVLLADLRYGMERRPARASRKGDQQMTDSQVEIATGTRFAFGANWKSFVNLVDETRIDAARRSLTEALGVTDLSGRRFLDIGCGSGLFSLAAHQLGARVRSFDFDPDSVAAAAELRRQYAPRSDWIVEQGSILDEQYRGRARVLRRRLLVGRAASHRQSLARR